MTWTVPLVVLVRVTSRSVVPLTLLVLLITPSLRMTPVVGGGGGEVGAGGVARGGLDGGGGGVRAGGLLGRRGGFVGVEGAGAGAGEGPDVVGGPGVGVGGFPPADVQSGARLDRRGAAG